MFTDFPQKEIYVFGHDNTDVDSYVSTILMSDLLRFHGYNSIPIILQPYEKIDVVTKDVVEKLGLDKLECIIPPENASVFLVDHNDFESSVENNNFNVIGVVDHHEETNIHTFFKKIQPSGSTTKLIYELMELSGFPISNHIKKCVLYSLSVDTTGLMNTKTSKSDIHFASNLCSELCLSLEVLKRETIFETDLTTTIEEMVSNGAKRHNIKGKKYISGYMEVFIDSSQKELEVKSLIEKILDLGKRKITNSESEGFFYILYDFENNKTTLFLIENSLSVEEIEYENKIVSRGKDIIPFIKNKN